MNDTSRALSRILNPRSIAVVGASNSFTSPATNLMASIISAGFPGNDLPDPPEGKDGPGPYRLPGPDGRPRRDRPCRHRGAVAGSSPAILAQCGQKGVRQAVVITAGYREMGAEGAVLEKELLAEAEEERRPLYRAQLHRRHQQPREA